MLLSPKSRIVDAVEIDNVLNNYKTDVRSINTLLSTNPNATPSEIMRLAGTNPLSVMFAKAKVKAMQAQDPTEKVRSEKAARQLEKLLDQGWAAMILGFDAIYHDNGFVTLMNRSAGAVLDTPVTVQKAGTLPRGKKPGNLVTSIPRYVPVPTNSSGS